MSKISFELKAVRDGFRLIVRRKGFCKFEIPGANVPLTCRHGIGPWTGDEAWDYVVNFGSNEEVKMLCD